MDLFILIQNVYEYIIIYHMAFSYQINSSRQMT